MNEEMKLILKQLDNISDDEKEVNEYIQKMSDDILDLLYKIENICFEIRRVTKNNEQSRINRKTDNRSEF